MPYEVTIIDGKNPGFPAPLREEPEAGRFQHLWAIGNIGLLQQKLLGFFCSIRCPGEAILQTYDAARALRDNGIPVIGGFHSPMEKEVLDILLRGTQPVIVCPARSIEKMRLPSKWRRPLDEGRFLLLSPFEDKHRRQTADLANQRNHLVGLLAKRLFVPWAAPGSKTEALCSTFLTQGKHVAMLKGSDNHRLATEGATALTLEFLIRDLSD